MVERYDPGIYPDPVKDGEYVLYAALVDLEADYAALCKAVIEIDKHSSVYVSSNRTKRTHTKMRAVNADRLAKAVALAKKGGTDND